MKVNPALVEWIGLVGGLVEALEIEHQHNCGHGVEECPSDCAVKSLVDRARRRLAKVKR